MYAESSCLTKESTARYTWQSAMMICRCSRSTIEGTDFRASAFFLILFLMVSITPASSLSHSFSVIRKSSHANCIFSSSNVIMAFRKLTKLAPKLIKGL